MDLEEFGAANIDGPKFRRLNAVFGGLPGRALACFEDGPYYSSLEWADALPIHASANTAQMHPVFFDERMVDLPPSDGRPIIPGSRPAHLESIREHAMNTGVYAIVWRTRMVVYLYLNDK